MRMLAAGLALLLLAVGLAEYARRHPTAAADAALAGAAVTARPPDPLLATEAAPADQGAGDAAAWAGLLEVPAGPTPRGFTAVAQGRFAARQLRGGFGAVLFLADIPQASALVRAAGGEAARVVAARVGHVTALHLDGSTAFFAEGGTVLSTGARGGEPVTVRVRFARAVVTSLWAVGDTVYVTLRPAAQPEGSEEATGAVARVESDGQVSLVAGAQVSPRAVTADGTEVYWVAGASPAVWRAPRDGSFAAKVAGEAAGPLALDGDGLLFRGTDEALWRVPRAGGAPVAVAPPGVRDFLAVSGLVRFTTSAGVFEVTAGSAPRELLATPAAPLGLTVAGTSLYVLTAPQPGSAAVLLKE